MDLNHIQLPASLLADFYKTHLVEAAVPKTGKTAPDENPGTKKTIQYLGKNQKGICLLVAYAKEVYLPDGQLHFLTTILQACRLNLGDVAIINCQREKISFETLRLELACNYLLVFGDSFPNIGLDEPPMFNIQQADDCMILYTPAAEELNHYDASGKLLKSRLWTCLKQMFNV